jgi:hypothetical protein
MRAVANTVTALVLIVACLASSAQAETAAIAAAKCKETALAIAARIDGRVGNQTNALVSIAYPKARDITDISHHYGTLTPEPRFSLIWEGSKRPSSDTLNVSPKRALSLQAPRSATSRNYSPPASAKP